LIPWRFANRAAYEAALLNRIAGRDLSQFSTVRVFRIGGYSMNLKVVWQISSKAGMTTITMAQWPSGDSARDLVAPTMRLKVASVVSGR
jgi:hypothetical protein